MEKHTRDENELDIADFRQLFDYFFFRNWSRVNEEVADGRQIDIRRVQDVSLGILFDEACPDKIVEFAPRFLRLFLGSLRNLGSGEGEAGIEYEKAHDLNLRLSSEN